MAARKTMQNSLDRAFANDCHYSSGPLSNLVKDNTFNADSSNSVITAVSTISSASATTDSTGRADTIIPDLPEGASIKLRMQGGWKRLANNWKVISMSKFVNVLSPAPGILECIVASYTLLPVPVRADVKQLEVDLQVWEDSGHSKDSSESGFVQRRVTVMALLRMKNTIVFSGLRSGQTYAWEASLICPDLGPSSSVLLESGFAKTAWADMHGGIKGLDLLIAEVAHSERSQAVGVCVRAASIQSCPEEPLFGPHPEVWERDDVRIIEVEEGVWFGHDPELADIVSNALDNTYLKTEENISQALHWCGLEDHAASLLQRHACFGIRNPVLWTTHPRWLRGVQDNEEYSRHVHVDGDCLAAACENVVPSDKSARNMWILLSETLTQPIVLVLQSGVCAYNPAMVRGSFVVFDYASIPHTALPHLRLSQNNDKKRQSIDYRFLGDPNAHKG